MIEAVANLAPYTKRTRNTRSGRNLKKLRSDRSLYSVRLNQQFRFVFLLFDNGIAKPVAVGPHDEAYAIN